MDILYKCIKKCKIRITVSSMPTKSQEDVMALLEVLLECGIVHYAVDCNKQYFEMLS